jgi:hypothetical protein
MVSIPKVVGVLSCACVLVLGLYLNASHIIKGEVVRVDPSAYFVKQYDGDQVRVHTDATTRMTGAIRPGDHIEAKVTAQRHALAIRQVE